MVRARRGRVRRVIMALLVAALATAALPSAKAQHPTELPTYLNTKPGVAYVGSAACKPCHGDIWESYTRTDMGRSISLADDPAELEKVKEPVSVYDRAIDRYFKVFSSNGQMVQSEYGLDSTGHVAFEHTERIAYAVGAGENGFSYLIDRGGYLFQAPLSYYSKIGKWDLSPAHELGFARPIEEGCISCHAGLPQPVANRAGLYRQPPFQELAIGCEKCHGPGELHVKARLAGNAVPAGGDSTIVNPARLPAWLANNACMYCHEKGDAEALQPGRTYLDFRPGTALDATLAVFRVPLQAGTTDTSPLLNHYFLMILSRCYRASAGGLSCLSCHDPHGQPTAAEAPSYYRKKCLQCHSTGSCSLPLTSRRTTTPPDDCVGCHMPKKSLTSISHSALTDHRIPARPDESYPAEAFRAPNAAIPGLIHLTAAPGKDDVVPPLTLLNAYAQLADDGPAYQAQYRRLLAQVAPAEPSNPVVLSLLARDALTKAQQSSPPNHQGADGKSGAEVEAIDDLTRAVRLGSTWLPDYELLGQLLARAGRFEEAVGILNRGVALAPYSPSLYPLLSACYAGLGNSAAAIKALQDGLKLFPEDASMREMLKKTEPKMH